MFSLGLTIGFLCRAPVHPDEVYMPDWAKRALTTTLALDACLVTILFRSLACSSS